MILRARTARSLSWPGRVAVLGLGLLLLPLFAVRAQDRPAPVRDTRDQQIEALKQAIRVLEEQKRAEGQRAAEPSVAPLPPVPASPRAASFPGLMPSAAQAAPPRRETSGAPPMREAADEQLEATARDLEKTIAAKRKELDVLEGKYRDVRAKLGERDPNWRRLQPTPFPPAGVPHRGVPYGPQFPPAGTPVPSTQRPEPTPAPSGGGGAGAQNRDRVRDVEMQLEKVLREVEALRREIQRGQSSGRSETGSPDRFKPPAPNTPYPAKP